MEKKILEVVLDIQATQIEMKEDIKDLKNRVCNLEEGQKSVEAGQKGLEALKRQDSLNIAKILEVQTKQFQEMI